MSRSSIAHLNALGTTVVSAQGGTLKRVVINSKGATANTLTLYDNAATATGNVLGVIDTTANVGFLEFECGINNGLVAVLAVGTSADVSIIFD